MIEFKMKEDGQTVVEEALPEILPASGAGSSDEKPETMEQALKETPENNAAQMTGTVNKVLAAKDTAASVKEMMTLEAFEEACEVVKGVTQETELIYSKFFSDQSGNKVYFKPENMQMTGAF